MRIHFRVTNLAKRKGEEVVEESAKDRRMKSTFVYEQKSVNLHKQREPFFPRKWQKERREGRERCFVCFLFVAAGRSYENERERRELTYGVDRAAVGLF